MYHRKVYLNIGNSFMTAGYFTKGVFVPIKRVPSEISSFKKLTALNKKYCGLIIVASVVPKLEKAVKKIYKNRVLVMRNDNVPVVNCYKNKKTAGIDRLLISLGAARKYGAPCLVVDFGTATTINLVGKRGEFKGGLICPGASLFSKYLFENTSKLPYISLAPVKKTVGRSTKDCIKAGVFYGYVEMVRGLILRLRKETGGNIKVIAAGGWGKLFSPYIKEIAVYEPYLVFYGMEYTVEKNSKSETRNSKKTEKKNKIKKNN
ncbi:MAG: type III pantothenate kinase [Candidatus Firestonebacteria bacterium]